MKEQLKQRLMVLFRRFLRGGVSTAVGLMIAVATPDIISGTWGDLNVWLTRLAYAGVVGLISGFLLAVDKDLRWKE
jgi:hypothetical protein